MESLIRVINWYDSDDGQDHITVGPLLLIILSRSNLSSAYTFSSFFLREGDLLYVVRDALNSNILVT